MVTPNDKFLKDLWRFEHPPEEEPPVEPPPPRKEPLTFWEAGYPRPGPGELWGMVDKWWTELWRDWPRVEDPAWAVAQRRERRIAMLEAKQAAGTLTVDEAEELLRLKPPIWALPPEERPPVPREAIVEPAVTPREALEVDPLYPQFVAYHQAGGELTFEEWKEMRGADEALLFAQYQRAGGVLDERAWRDAGTPIIAVPLEEGVRAFGQRFIDRPPFVQRFLDAPDEPFDIDVYEGAVAKVGVGTEQLIADMMADYKAMGKIRGMDIVMRAGMTEEQSAKAMAESIAMTEVTGARAYLEGMQRVIAEQSYETTLFDVATGREITIHEAMDLNMREPDLQVIIGYAVGGGDVIRTEPMPLDRAMRDVLGLDAEFLARLGREKRFIGVKAELETRIDKVLAMDIPFNEKRTAIDDLIEELRPGFVDEMGTRGAFDFLKKQKDKIRKDLIAGMTEEELVEAGLRAPPGREAPPREPEPKIDMETLEKAIEPYGISLLDTYPYLSPISQYHLGRIPVETLELMRTYLEERGITWADWLAVGRGLWEAPRPRRAAWAIPRM